MKLSGWIGAACLALLLAGCNNQGAKSPANNHASTGSPPPSKQQVPTPNIPSDAFNQGEPGTAGWKTSKDKLVQLGQKMDDAMRPTEPILCRGEIIYEDPSIGKMQFHAEVRIQDDKHFHIEYVMPGTGSSLNRLIGDGKRRVVRKQDKWIELASFSKQAAPNVDDLVERFPRDFPELMFAHFSDGSDVWAPLFDGWQKGLQGYTTTFEEHTYKLEGKEVTQYRIQARTKEKPVTQIEMMVDKQRSLPLTIKVTGHIEDGREYNLRWTAGWQFGGTYDAKAFVIPAPAP